MAEQVKIITEIIKRRELPYWALAPTLAAGYILSKAVSDYREWRALGEGGLPLNVFGWIVAGVCKFSRMTDTRSISHFAPEEASGGYLGSILAREGSRPTMAKFVVPLRATDQDPYPDMAIKIEDLYASLAAKFPTLILMKTSKLEKFCTALFLSNPTVASPSKEIHYEMAHYHPYDHSSMVVLHPADAKRVIEAGWGELHPLAGKANFYARLPKTYVLVYAPRNDKELETTQAILEACIRYHAK